MIELIPEKKASPHAMLQKESEMGLCMIGESIVAGWKQLMFLLLLLLLSPSSWSQAPHDFEPTFRQSVERLDSTYNFTFVPEDSLWDPNGRTRYEYPSENETISIFQTRNPGSVHWQNYRRHISVFDSGSNTREKYLARLDFSSWVNDSRTIWEWDSAQQYIRFEILSWENAQWVGERKILNQYTASSLISERVRQHWDVNQNDWINFQRNSYGYTASDKLQLEEREYWNEQSQVWEIYVRHTHTYDSLDRQTIGLTEYFSLGSPIPDEQMQDLYLYDQQGNNTEIIQEMWDPNLGPIGSWALEGRILLSYDFLGRTLSETEQYWEQNQGGLVNATRRLSEYDMFDNPLSRIEQVWDTSLQVWENVDQTLSAWDAESRIAEVAIFQWEDVDWIKQFRQIWAYTPLGNTQTISVYTKQDSANE